MLREWLADRLEEELMRTHVAPVEKILFDLKTEIARASQERDRNDLKAMRQRILDRIAAAGQ